MVVLADLLEECVRVGSGDVPVVNYSGLFEPLLSLLERDEVSGSVRFSVTGETVELAAQPGSTFWLISVYYVSII